ncbi:MAG: hypothetical protein DWQ34_15600 [Planctomycetota bacterium]|nr:MAG: hypothetical protein DWQ34_15600 [Planctomycetota bacterium]
MAKSLTIGADVCTDCLPSDPAFGGRRTGTFQPLQPAIRFNVFGKQSSGAIYPYLQRSDGISRGPHILETR